MAWKTLLRRTLGAVLLAGACWQGGSSALAHLEFARSTELDRYARLPSAAETLVLALGPHHEAYLTAIAHIPPTARLLYAFDAAEVITRAIEPWYTLLLPRRSLGLVGTAGVPARAAVVFPAEFDERLKREDGLAVVLSLIDAAEDPLWLLDLNTGWPGDLSAVGTIVARNTTCTVWRLERSR